MTKRTDEEVIVAIKELIETNVKPAVAGHGGNIEFVAYENGHLQLELGGACSGCAGSTMTLKMGVENMLKHFVPEVQTVEAFDDPFSTVDPYYMDNMWDFEDLEEDEDHEPNS
jgi:Fe-S cluster biogenesis protein NfuA